MLYIIQHSTVPLPLKSFPPLCYFHTALNGQKLRQPQNQQKITKFKFDPILNPPRVLLCKLTKITTSRRRNIIMASAATIGPVGHVTQYATWPILLWTISYFSDVITKHR